MELSAMITQMLELIPQPAFYVQNGIIEGVNYSAAQKQITVGAKVSDLLHTGKAEYAAFTEGELSLALSIDGIITDAWVVKNGAFDIFRLENETAEASFLAYFKAAKELREPLSGAMAATIDALNNAKASGENEEKLQQINRGLYRMLRLVDNMSAAKLLTSKQDIRFTTKNISAIFNEIMEQAAILVEKAGCKLHFAGLNKAAYGLANRQLLEQAVYNLISNAIKFSAPGNVLEAKLTAGENKLYFTFSDTGLKVDKKIASEVFSHHSKQPDIDDGRRGIGLGMVTVRAAAAAHNGTVLIQQPENAGLRITMSISLRQSSATALNSPVRTIAENGGYSTGLIQLSDVLPHTAYDETF